jgi:hypothetical protein
MTPFACRRVEKALARDGAPALSGALARHAAACPRCRDRQAAAESLFSIAPSLRKAWDSPELFGRIAAAISAERLRPTSPSEAATTTSARRRVPWLALSATAALFGIAAIGLQVFRDSSGKQLLVTPNLGRDPLLSETTVAEVDKTEAAYVRSIDKLAESARPRLEGSPSPLFASYREKLLLLDSAIADLRAEIDRNRGNAHLRRELLAIYREKQRTLQDLMKERES